MSLRCQWQLGLLASIRINFKTMQLGRRMPTSGSCCMLTRQRLDKYWSASHVHIDFARAANGSPRRRKPDSSSLSLRSAILQTVSRRGLSASSFGQTSRGTRVRTSTLIPRIFPWARARVRRGWWFHCSSWTKRNNKHDRRRVENELVAGRGGFREICFSFCSIWWLCVSWSYGITCQLIDCRSFRVLIKFSRRHLNDSQKSDADLIVDATLGLLSVGAEHVTST